MRFCEGVIILAKKKRAKTSKKHKVKRKLVRKVKPKKKAARKAVAKFKRKVAKKTKKPAKKSSKGSSASNLMITYDPTHRSLAEAEVTDVFKKIAEEVKFLTSEIEGVFKVATSKPRDSVKKLARLCMKEPDLFKTTYKYV